MASNKHEVGGGWRTLISDILFAGRLELVQVSVPGSVAGAGPGLWFGGGWEGAVKDADRGY